MHIYTGGRPSESARRLADVLGIRRIRNEGPRLRTDCVINWGCSAQLPDRVHTTRVLNDPLAVQVASNKLAFFEAVRDAARTPEWTTNRDLGVAWRENGHTVVARTLLRASGGDGIVICEPGGVDIPNAPLYTKYVPKTHEYRVHVRKWPDVDEDAWQNWTFMQQRKVRRTGAPVENWKVRNLENGFIYQLENYNNIPFDVVLQAVKAFECTNLDFGAVDVMWHEGREKAYVLEINTAPGLEERTARMYADALKQL